LFVYKLPLKSTLVRYIIKSKILLLCYFRKRQKNIKMKVKLLHEAHHRLRHRNRMNPVDRFVDAQYRNRLPNEQSHHLFVDTCLNKKSLYSRMLQTREINGGLLFSAPTIQFSEDGSLLAYGDCTDVVQLWDAGKILVSRDIPDPIMFKYPEEVGCVSLSPDNSHIFASCPNLSTIYIHNIQK